MKKCLCCEKEIKEEKHFLMGAGSLLLNFGYGSKFDQFLSASVQESVLDSLVSCQKVVAYICDDCFELKSKLFEGYNIVVNRQEKIVVANGQKVSDAAD